MTDEPRTPDAPPATEVTDVYRLADGDRLDELVQALGAVPASAPNEALRAVLAGRSHETETTDHHSLRSPTVTTLHTDQRDWRDHRGRLALLGAVAAIVAIAAVGLTQFANEPTTVEPAATPVAGGVPAGDTDDISDTDRPDPATVESWEVGVVSLGDAGFAAIDLVNGEQLVYLDTDLAEGWSAEPITISDELVELRYVSGERQVDLQVEIEDGRMKALVRSEPDGDWVEVPTEPSVMVVDDDDAEPRPVSTTEGPGPAPDAGPDADADVVNGVPLDADGNPLVSTTAPAEPATDLGDEEEHPEGYTRCTTTPTTMENRPCLPGTGDNS